MSWALPRISRLLPIDHDSLKEVITYSVSLSKEEAAAHLKNLLGDSAQALEFISSFNSRRAEDTKTPSSKTTSPTQNTSRPSGDREESSVSSPWKRAHKGARLPLHSAGPVREPEGYGDVAGGYRKPSPGDTYSHKGSKHTPAATSISTALALSQDSAAQQLPKVTQQLYSPTPSSSRDPSPPRHKRPPSASGSLISDLPNVRTKQSKKTVHSGASTPRSTTTTTASINDLTSAIAALELSTNPSLSTERRKCPCNASIHPLFATAPNCLSCGKIICALEGLQPCSFCDAPILTREQVQGMIRALKEERGQERMAAHNAGASHSGSGTPAFGFPGGNTPETSGDEASGAAARARAHRDKLLSFQRDNAQRTKVHDEAADYDMTLTPGTSQWMSPLQRAAALKKQQKYLREMEELNKPEWEKKKTVMSMSIKNGKLVKTYETVKAPTPKDAEPSDIDEVEPADTPDDMRKGAFGNNPLLADGKLLRPIWKAPDGDKGKGREVTSRQNKWRRVQDDDDNNEQWILDGGIHGFDDGSQQECG
jgi:hypothetical protein